MQMLKSQLQGRKGKRLYACLGIQEMHHTYKAAYHLYFITGCFLGKGGGGSLYVSQQV